jgi:hypothetical protein
MTPDEPRTPPLVVRISLGRIDPARAEDTIAALEASEAVLRPAIGALPGLVGYYVGFDRERSAITNTSIWLTREDALAMSTLPEMAELRTVFEQLGVVFEPVGNFDTMWEI